MRSVYMILVGIETTMRFSHCLGWYCFEASKLQQNSLTLLWSHVLPSHLQQIDGPDSF
jgi:hypothetical protein